MLREEQLIYLILKKYKELLDGGVITQEEFDAKKKQLLGLSFRITWSRAYALLLSLLNVT